MKIHRKILTAAGQIGAARVVRKVIFDALSSIAQKTASVTANVVRHKYGNSAGQVIKDIGDTTGNILSTVCR